MESNNSNNDFYVAQYKKNRLIGFILIVIIILVVLFFIIFPIIKRFTPLSVANLQDILEEKYGEQFENISLIKTVKNPSDDIYIDGTYFGKTLGIGKTRYYKVYSVDNDLEYFAYYSESDPFKTIYDTYEKYLNRKITIGEAYNTFIEYLGNDINDIVFNYGPSGEESTQKKINSYEFLTKLLSKYNNDSVEKYSAYSGSIINNDLIIYINQDILDYSKKNYDTIIKLNNQIATLKNKYNFCAFLFMNNNMIIELASTDDKPIVADISNSAHYWEEPFDDFVKRESY